jgi:hypothetical protein
MLHHHHHHNLTLHLTMRNMRKKQPDYVKNWLDNVKKLLNYEDASLH